MSQHTIAFLFKRRPGMSLEDFSAYYRDIHGAVARQLPGLVEYRQYPLRSAGAGDIHFHADSGFDGLSIFTFASAAAAEAAWNSAVNVEVQVDTLKFIDVESMVTLPLTQRIIM